ncbi:MAG: putative secreted lipase [Linnemannia elongata]|nr:MAG: putative secreted lipase [Linnemannia elongata]
MKFSITSILSTVAAALAIFSSVQAAAVPTPVEIQKRAIEGINNYACKMTPAHPRPLLLVHGTTLTLDSWSTWAPLLIKEGYCVFGLTYGKYKDVPLLGGIAPIEENAHEVANFANNVLTRMNATQLDYIGHSQGGILGRYWIKYLDGAGKINRMVGVSPIHHGTTLSGITTFASALHLLNPVQPILDAVAPALYQMIVGSPFMQKLNAGGDTSPGVIHSNIATRYDEIVTPWETCYQDAPGVINTLLQDLCLLALNEHITIINSKIALRWALNQLDPSTAKTANCLSVF